MNQRASDCRVETSERLEVIKQARDLLYKTSCALGNKKLEELLKAHSWVPTKVCIREYLCGAY